MNKKYEIIWKNDFLNGTNEVRMRKMRYMFLLELFLACVKEKDFSFYDKYRNISEYIEFTKSENMKQFDYNRYFLKEDSKYDEQYKTELIKNYFNNIHNSKKNLILLRHVLFYLSLPIIIISGLLYFIQRTDLFLYILAIGIGCLLWSGIIFLYLRGHLMHKWFIYNFIMKPDVFLENLEYEKTIIEENNYSVLNNLSGLMKFETYIPEFRIYLCKLLERDYIAIIGDSIHYILPCSQTAFAKLLEDPLFKIKEKLPSVPKQVFVKLFGKPLNELEQRNPTKNYDIIRNYLIHSGAPINKEYL